MHVHGLVIASAALVTAFAPVASGAIVNYTTYASWAGVSGTSVLGTEDFEPFNGGYPSSISRTTAGVTWNASSPADIFVGNWDFIRRVSTNDLGTLTMSYSYAGGLSGVGGNIFATDIDFGFMSGNVSVRVTLTDASSQSFTRSMASATDFWGFHSTGAAIASIDISTTGTYSQAAFATISNMAFMSGGAAVPGPSAIALAGLTGLVARGRRRADIARP